MLECPERLKAASKAKGWACILVAAAHGLLKGKAEASPRCLSTWQMGGEEGASCAGRFDFTITDGMVPGERHLFSMDLGGRT